MSNFSFPPTHRRNLFISGFAFAALLAIGIVSVKAAPPRPQNVISPDQALARLIAGNNRYIAGDMKSHDFVAERPALVAGQNPFASVLSCSDSRIAPELAFDTGRGDLFVVRVAGNFVTKEGLASMEFSVAVLKSPLIVVMGHESCGAIVAAIAAATKGTVFPGHLPSLTKGLKPAVVAAEKESGNLVENATTANVRLNVEKFKNASPILKKAVESGQVKVVGAVYHLATGKVEFLN